MLLFWALRHTFYFGIVFLLLAVEPMASSRIVHALITGVFLIAHAWKFLAFFLRHDERAPGAAVSPATAELPAAKRVQLDVTLALGGGRSSGLGLGAVKGIVQVVSLGSGTPAAEAGLHVGDQIVAVDGVQCGANVRQVQQAFARAAGGVALTIERAGARVAPDHDGALGTAPVAALVPRAAAVPLPEV